MHATSDAADDIALIDAQNRGHTMILPLAAQCFKADDVHERQASSRADKTLEIF